MATVTVTVAVQDHHHVTERLLDDLNLAPPPGGCDLEVLLVPVRALDVA
jgi:hypothetical protein